MTEPRPEDVVHQAFFGWSHDDGKLTLLSHSFLRMEEATRWLRRLEAHLRLEPVSGLTLPPQAVSYFDYGDADGSVAVLRRVTFGYSNGRNNSHALIGSVAALGIPAALGLGRWPGWQDTPPPGVMKPIPAAHFRTAKDTVDKQLRPFAERIERQLGAVLTQILEHPDDPLSVVGCPDEDRLAMVWGLREASDGYLQRQLGVHRSWSFSTYEDRHDVNIEGLPEIVFLPVKPEGAAVVQRIIVELHRDPPISPMAGQLIARLLHAEQPVLDSVGTRSGAGVHEDLRSTPPKQVKGLLPPGLDGGRPGEPLRPGGTPQHGYQYQGQTASADRNLAARLLDVESVQDFDAELRGLQTSPYAHEQRKQLRAALDVDAMNKAAEFIEVRARAELLRRLLEVAYGPRLEDLYDPKAWAHAMSLIRDGESEQLAMMLGAAAPRRDRTKVQDAAFDRWIAGGRSPAPTGRIVKAYRSARRSRYLPYVTGVAAAAVLVVMFLLGFLAGQPAPAQQPPAASSDTTAPSSTQPPASSTTSAISQVQPTSGRVTIIPGQNQQVFGFLRVGNKYYPQSPCTQVNGEPNTWECNVSKDMSQVAAGGQPTLVAITVPQVNDLQNKPAGEPFDGRQQGWGNADVPVS